MEYSNKIFFDETSEFYNSMIDSDTAIDRRVKLFSNMKVKNEIVADLGCGSGIDSFALSKCGNTVDAFDPSPKMIKLAAKTASEKKFEINFHTFAIEDIPKQFEKKYSFICSLGNTIANVDSKKLTQSFQKIKNILKPNGRALIHILNFDLILSRKERILNITEKGDTNFIRFYDFVDDHIVFNILKFTKKNRKEHNLISTKLFPHTFETILTTLNLISFSNLDFYGSFNFEKFDIAHSKDLLISITK